MVRPGVSKMPRSDLPKIIIAATTPFAVNAFLSDHITALSKRYQIILCTNIHAYELLPCIESKVEVRDISFARRISFFADVKSLFQLFSIFRKFRPIAVHSITPKAGLLAMIAGAVYGVPNRWHTFTGQVWATKQGFARRVLKIMDRLIAFSASQVFADSMSQCRLLCYEGVVREGGISVLGSGSIAGVDLERFRPDVSVRTRVRQKMRVGDKSCVFLFIGRLVRDKGVFDLINAFKEVAEVTQQVELWMVGPDEDGLVPKLREVAGDCQATIRWLGRTKTPENFMAAADVLVLPSYREGFGSVIIEAAACGVPAIAYHIDGVIDALEDGNSGLLVEVGQVMAFAEAMKSLAFNDEIRQCLGSQARERAVSDFNSHSVTKAWTDFYGSHLDNLA